METKLSVNQTPPRNSFKKTLLIVGAAGVALLGGLGTAYAKYDLFKSPKTIYLESEAQGIAEFSTELSGLVAEYEKQMKPYLESTVNSKMEISNLKVEANLPDPQAQKILDLLKDTQLVVESNVDDQKQKQFTKMNLLIKEKNLIGFEMFLDQTKLGFGVPDLYPKYAFLDLQDRDALKEKFPVDQLPKRIVTYTDFYNALKFSKEEVATIALGYAKIYADGVSDKQVTLKNDVAFSQDGFQASTRELTVTFTDQEFSALLTKLVEKAETDDKLFDLFYTRYQNVTKLMIDSGYPDVKEQSKEELKAEYKKALEDMKKEITAGDAKGGMKMVLNIDSSDQILSRKIIPVDEQGKEDAGYIQTAKWMNQGEQNYLFALSGTSPDGDKDEVKLSYKSTEKGSEQKGSIGFIVKSSLDEQVESLFDIKTQFTTIKEADKETGTIDFSVNIEDPASGTEKVAFSGKIDSTMVKKDNTRDGNTTIQLNFQEQDPTFPKSIGLQLKTYEKFGKEVKLPALTGDNSINMATITDEDMVKLEEELATAGQQFMLKNMALFQELQIMP